MATARLCLTPAIIPKLNPPLVDGVESGDCPWSIQAAGAVYLDPSSKGLSKIVWCWDEQWSGVILVLMTEALNQLQGLQQHLLHVLVVCHPSFISLLKTNTYSKCLSQNKAYWYRMHNFRQDTVLKTHTQLTVCKTVDLYFIISNKHCSWYYIGR